MSFTYKLFANYPAEMGGGESKFILRKEDGAVIPKDEANTDYQAYLLWVSEGGVTEAADYNLSCILLVIIPIVT